MPLSTQLSEAPWSGTGCLVLSIAALFMVSGTIAPAALANVPAPPAAISTVSGPSDQYLTLGQAIGMATAISPSLRAQVAAVAQARAKLDQAKAGRRIQLSFSATAGASDAKVYTPPPDHESFGTLQSEIMTPIPIGSRPALAVQQADARLAAADAQYAATRHAVASDVIAAYYDVLRKQALLRIAVENLETANRQLTEVRRRNRAQDVSDLDVIRASVPAAAADGVVTTARYTLLASQQTLNALIGRPLEATVTLSEVPIVAPRLSVSGPLSTPAVPAAEPPRNSDFGDLLPGLDAARKAAVEASPDIRAADADVTAAKAVLRYARAYHEPSLSLGLVDTRTGDVTGLARVDEVQATVTVPLSDGGLGNGQVREAEGTLAEARTHADLSRAAVILGVSTAYVTDVSASAQVAATQEAAQVASTVYDKTLVGYTAGLFALTDVLTAQSALVQARLAYAQAQYDAALADAVLNLTTTDEFP